MAGSAEFIELALASTEAEFTRQCPFYFLMGDTILVPPDGPEEAGAFPATDTDPGDWDADYTAVPEPDPVMTNRLLVLPVRKVQENFPSMITVGRTRNNDIVLHDISVSKFHAYFKMLEGRVELSDAGSLAGTWVGSKRLAPKGVGCVVEPGVIVRFAHNELQFVDAAACWARVRALAALH